ncbi:phosphoglycerate kinase [Pantoea sp. Mhis]|uniref:phosphoglycerate kinase n=1 Tax=Pantoea sp. Mhis TaxID=2576759 RepID=UPI00135BE037|nr:phosphoglycerate kinase [Pantoea sp. Mhis]MXP56683.1 phosphoglycerate kinase [Pantoea sp. Mhis]
MSLIKMTDLNLADKRVLIRTDFNVPLKNGIITSDARIQAALPTISSALKQGARVIVASHLGRPQEGKYDKYFSLNPIVNNLKDKLKDIKITLATEYLNGVDIGIDELIILENVRFNKGERENNEFLSKQYAALCDIFIMDAFASAHRIEASTYGVSKFAPIACAGQLLCKELESLSQVMSNPKYPMVAIVGGSKVSSKFDLLNSLAKITDTIIVGGGIANTFIAIDQKVGKSLYEPDCIERAKMLRNKYNIIIPTDVRVISKSSINTLIIEKNVSEIKENEEIMDIGNKTAYSIAQLLKTAKTIVWNGPVGMFEIPSFRKGTEIIANAIAESDALSIAGGGDTIAAIELFGIENYISYISTGGGAFLKFIEGNQLPVVKILEDRVK